METRRSAETAELVTDGLLAVQSFVVRAIPLPPGTPAKPRSGRPASQAVTVDGESISPENEEKSDARQSNRDGSNDWG